jgi:hypothetical protein
MDELLKYVLNNPEVGPKALDNAEHVVISGIETTGRIVECLVKDGKIVEHSAKTVQDAVKSTENVAISIVETGGKISEYFIKDGEIVKHTAETVQLGVKTTGDVAKELVDRGTGSINKAIETAGNVTSELFSGLFGIMKSESVWNGFISLLKTTSDLAFSMTVPGKVLKTSEKVVDMVKKIPFRKKNSDEIIKAAYELNSYMSDNFPPLQFPELKPIKRLLDASVKKNNPELIAETIQVIQEEINNMQNIVCLNNE